MMKITSQLFFQIFPFIFVATNLSIFGLNQIEIPSLESSISTILSSSNNSFEEIGNKTLFDREQKFDEETDDFEGFRSRESGTNRRRHSFEDEEEEEKDDSDDIWEECRGRGDEEDSSSSQSEEDRLGEDDENIRANLERKLDNSAPIKFLGRHNYHRRRHHRCHWPYGKWGPWRWIGQCTDFCGGFGRRIQIRKCRGGHRCPCRGRKCRVHRCNLEPCTFPSVAASRRSARLICRKWFGAQHSQSIISSSFGAKEEEDTIQKNNNITFGPH